MCHYTHHYISHYISTVLLYALPYDILMSDKTSAVAEMGDHGHNRQWAAKRGAAVPLLRELGPCLVKCRLGRGLLPYQAASSSIQPFGHNRRGPKTGWGGCALFLGVAGSTSNTISRSPAHPIAHSPQFLAHVYCGQTVAHLSYW